MNLRLRRGAAVRVSLAGILIANKTKFVNSGLYRCLLTRSCSMVYLSGFSANGPRGVFPFLRQCPGGFGLVMKSVQGLGSYGGTMRGMSCIVRRKTLNSIPHSVGSPVAAGRAGVSKFLGVLATTHSTGMGHFVCTTDSSACKSDRSLPGMRSIVNGPLSPCTVAGCMGRLCTSIFTGACKVRYVNLQCFGIFNHHRSPFKTCTTIVPLFIGGFVTRRDPIVGKSNRCDHSFACVSGIVRVGVLTVAAAGPGTAGRMCGATFKRHAALGRLINCLGRFLDRFSPRVTGIGVVRNPGHLKSVPRSLTYVSGTGSLLNCGPRCDVHSNLGRTIG